MEIRPFPEDAEALGRFAREGPFVWLWEYPGTACVLGAATPLRDVDLTACAAAGVPVYRRRGGGGAVVLAPGTLIITACYEAGRRRFPTQWMEPIAQAVARTLRDLGVAGATVRGLGDVAVAERKVLGSSLYVNRQVALYQGSLLVNTDLSLISRLLPHPSREPAYRAGRPHGEFLTSLAREGLRCRTAELQAALEAELRRV